MGINGTGFPLGGSHLPPAPSGKEQSQSGERSPAPQQNIAPRDTEAQHLERRNFSQIHEQNLAHQIATAGLESRINLLMLDRQSLGDTDLVEKLADLFVKELTGSLSPREYCDLLYHTARQNVPSGDRAQLELLTQVVHSQIAISLLREQMDMQKPLQ